MWMPEAESQNVEDRRPEGPPWWYALGLEQSPGGAFEQMIEDLRNPFTPRMGHHKETMPYYEHNPLSEALGIYDIPNLNPDFSAGNPDPTIRRVDPSLGRLRR